MLARVRAALDEDEAALADFQTALELSRPDMAPAGNGPFAVPAHQALHNLEQLAYLEQVDNLAPGALLPVPASVLFVPSTLLALKLAAVLGTRVEKLFWVE